MNPNTVPHPGPLSPSQVASKIYGPAFDHTSRRELALAQQDFKELTPVEQQFTYCHLLYLILQSQTRTQQLLQHVLLRLEGLHATSYAIAELLAQPPIEAALPPEDAFAPLAGPPSPAAPPAPAAQKAGISFDELEARAAARSAAASLTELDQGPGPQREAAAQREENGHEA